jgi:hypothetical protein
MTAASSTRHGQAPDARTACRCTQPPSRPPHVCTAIAIPHTANPGIVQTVLTGSLRAVARTKLRVFGLGGSIDCEAGAYGEDVSERAKHRGHQEAGVAAYRNVFRPPRGRPGHRPGYRALGFTRV